MVRHGAKGETRRHQEAEGGMSYPYHMGLWDKAQHEARMLATVRIATMKERDACARMLELRDSELLLMAGEMTAQELRTVKAVLAQRASAIRMRSNVQGDRLRATTDLQEGEEA